MMLSMSKEGPFKFNSWVWTRIYKNFTPALLFPLPPRDVREIDRGTGSRFHHFSSTPASNPEHALSLKTSAHEWDTGNGRVDRRCFRALLRLPTFSLLLVSGLLTAGLGGSIDDSFLTRKSRVRGSILVRSRWFLLDEGYQGHFPLSSLNEMTSMLPLLVQKKALSALHEEMYRTVEFSGVGRTSEIDPPTLNSLTHQQPCQCCSFLSSLVEAFFCCKLWSTGSILAHPSG